MGVVLEESTIDDDRNSNNCTPRPESLSTRNLLSFSKDITGLAAALRPSSRKLKRTRMLADLEDYNNLFSSRLSGGDVDTGRGGQGHGSTSVCSRGTSQTNSGRTVSDLDVEPAAAVKRPSPCRSEGMCVDDDKMFGAVHGKESEDKKLVQLQARW